MAEVERDFLTVANEADRLLIDAGAKGDNMLERMRFYMNDHGVMEDRAAKAEQYVAELHGAESIEQMEVAVASIATVQARIAELEQALTTIENVSYHDNSDEKRCVLCIARAALSAREPERREDTEAREKAWGEVYASLADEEGDDPRSSSAEVSEGG